MRNLNLLIYKTELEGKSCVKQAKRLIIQVLL